MRTHRVTATIAALMALTGIGFANPAQAEILASGPVYGGQGGPPGGQVTCRIFNAGLGTVTIPLRQIFANTNALTPLVSDTCGVPLGVGQYCAFNATIVGNFAYSCRAYATGVDVDLRGVAEVKNGANVILNTLPMD